MPPTPAQWAATHGRRAEDARTWVGHLLAGGLLTVGHSDAPTDDEPFGGWYVRYEGDAATTFADWVEASTTALARLVGVTAAWVEDADLVLVEGDVDRAHVRHALEAWWRPRLEGWLT